MGKKTNAKIEFTNHISHASQWNGSKILCATINTYLDVDNHAPEELKLDLTTGWTKEEWNEFIEKLDFEYDSGYGSQKLFGCIWYTDGTWSTRGEYDGSEWWEHHSCPPIPVELDRKDKVREEKLNNLL